MIAFTSSDSRCHVEVGASVADELRLPGPGVRCATQPGVFYFFRRGSETVHCEVRVAGDGPGYEIVICEQNGAQSVERFATSDQVHQRWVEIHKSLEVEGWWGPATQDGRG